MLLHSTFPVFLVQFQEQMHLATTFNYEEVFNRRQDRK